MPVVLTIHLLFIYVTTQESSKGFVPEMHSRYLPTFVCNDKYSIYV